MLKFSRDISACKGYKLTQLEEVEGGLVGNLSLRDLPANAFGRDIVNLTVQVEYQDENRLRVHLLDSSEAQYQIPSATLPLPPHQKLNARSSALEFHHRAEPFCFWIVQKSTVSIIFDTRPENIPVHTDAVIVPDLNTEYDSSGSNMWGLEDSDNLFRNPDGTDSRTALPSYPLIFEDQYLQIATALPQPANIYGLGEVIASSGLRRNDELSISTMWNRDTGGSPLDQSMYGSHPFYLETRGDELSAHGVAMRNCHGMDVILRPGVLEYRILGGTLDLYFFAGPDPISVVRQYSMVTGKPAQMPSWAFGYHMLRWGGEFESIAGMRNVVEKMREENIPYETVWSDLDHMDGRRNWTCNPIGFEKSEFRAFVDWLHQHEQRFVPLVDVAIGLTSADGGIYDSYERGHKRNIFLKNDDGSEYIARVWPGPAVYPDWTSDQTRDWWAEENDTFHRQIPYDGLWLDMNEPTNFLPGLPGAATLATLERTSKEHAGGQPLTCLKDVTTFDVPPYAIHDAWKGLGRMSISPSARHANGQLHYNMHNLYSLGEVQATRYGLCRRDSNTRPFILTRSSTQGTGSVCAKWLGDNRSTWQSMRDSVQGVLQFQMFHIPMIGPDACGMGQGFDVTEELANRWTQLAAFYPFMRNHNGHECRPQEPYRWESVARTTRRVLEARYKLLPYWESLFIDAHLDGTPPVQPLFFQFQKGRLAAHDSQFMVGSALLVTPVLHKGHDKVQGIFPSDNGASWRNWWSHELVETDQDDNCCLSSEMEQIQVHIRSGSVVPTYAKAEYTTAATRRGPIALVIHLDQFGHARGEFKMDDGVSIRGPKRTVKVSAEARSITIKTDGDYQVPSSNHVTVITLLGVSGEQASVAGTVELTGLDIDLNVNSHTKW